MILRGRFKIQDWSMEGSHACTLDSSSCQACKSSSRGMCSERPKSSMLPFSAAVFDCVGEKATPEVSSFWGIEGRGAWAYCMQNAQVRRGSGQSDNKEAQASRRAAAEYSRPFLVLSPQRRMACRGQWQKRIQEPFGCSWCQPDSVTRCLYGVSQYLPFLPRLTSPTSLPLCVSPSIAPR